IQDPRSSTRPHLHCGHGSPSCKVSVTAPLAPHCGQSMPPSTALPKSEIPFSNRTFGTVMKISKGCHPSAEPQNNRKRSPFFAPQQLLPSLARIYVPHERHIRNCPPTW